MKKIILLSMLATASASYADTYHYVGPSDANGHHMDVTFKVTGSLAPNTDYINGPANLNLISGSIAVLDAAGNNAGASTPIPVTNWISIHTDANKLPLYWVVGSNVSQITTTNNDPATSSGPWWQAYTNKAPAGWAGYLVAVDYEQYTYDIEYPVAQGCPAATPCNAGTTAWDALTNSYIQIPTYSPFNFIINPTNSTTANWTVTPDNPVNPVVVLAVSAKLPAATVGQAYSGSITVSNGTAPYTITMAGLPSGLTSTNGVVTGTPTVAGTFPITINVSDSVGDTAVSSAVLTVNAPVAVTVPNEGQSVITKVDAANKFTISGGGAITTNASTVVQWNRKSHVYRVGDQVEWVGKTVKGVFVASSVILN